MPRKAKPSRFQSSRSYGEKKTPRRVSQFQLLETEGLSVASLTSLSCIAFVKASKLKPINNEWSDCLGSYTSLEVIVIQCRTNSKLPCTCNP